MTLLDDLQEEATEQEADGDCDTAWTAELLRKAKLEIERLQAAIPHSVYCRLVSCGMPEDASEAEQGQGFFEWLLKREAEVERLQGEAKPTLPWRSGGAQGNLGQLFEDGEQYLFAVRIVHPRQRWEFVVVAVSCDGENPAEFEVEGGPWDAWSWDDVEWFVPCREIRLVVPIEAANAAER